MKAKWRSNHKLRGSKLKALPPKPLHNQGIAAESISPKMYLVLVLLASAITSRKIARAKVDDQVHIFVRGSRVGGNCGWN